MFATQQATVQIASFSSGKVWTADGKYPVMRVDSCPAETLPARGHQLVNGVLYVATGTDWRTLISLS